MKKRIKKTFMAILFLCAAIGISWFLLTIFIRPSNNRKWTKDQSRLAYAEIDGNLIHIKNIRNFTYKDTDQFTASYYDKTFELNKLISIDFVVELFSDFSGAAHTFLSFGFDM